MKKLYLFIFLLMSFISYSQVKKYDVTISNLRYKINAGVKRTSDDSKVRITIFFESGPPKEMYLRRITKNGDSENGLNIPTFRSSQKPISIECHAFVNFRTGSDANDTKTVDISGICASGNFSGYYSPRMTNVTFRYAVEPQLDVFPSISDLLPTDENIDINSSPGYDSGYYRWQYTLKPAPNNTTDWIDFAKYKTPSISTNANEVMGIDASTYHGTKIYFRIKPCGTVSGDKAEFSIRLSAPKIISSAPQKVSCYDSKSVDGKLKIQFDRALYQGEIFSITLSVNESIRNINDIAQLNPDNTYEISGLSRGDYKLTINGTYNGAITYSKYTDDGGVPYPFTIEAPSPVDFTVIPADINCNGGTDGTITIKPTGGSRDLAGNDFYSLDGGTNWVGFPNNDAHTITGLPPGDYSIKVKDMNGCIAKIQKTVGGIINLGAEKEEKPTLSQPSSPVSLEYTSIEQPKFYGGTNGILVVAVSGGTMFADNSYWYEWKNSAGVVLSSVLGEYVDGSYYITLKDIPSDTYTLTVRDKNYSSATNKEGCTVLKSEQFLDQPDPLVVTFEVKKTISCNVANEFGNETDFNPTDGQRDESQNGILIAHVTGGVPLTPSQNKGLLYFYYWKKQQSDGSWLPWDDHDNSAQNLSYGTYALNIEDKNGIRLGTYINNILTKEIDSIQFMDQPQKLEVAFNKLDVSCSSGNSGWAQANPLGGTAPYSYEWSNQETTQKITDLTPSNYFVMIKDAKGCVVQGTTLLIQPNEVQFNEAITNPTCYHGLNGAINIPITGGTAPFKFEWSTGATTQNISNLTAGNYAVQVTDDQDCVYNKNFVITDPQEKRINLGPDRTLCKDQVLDLDATIADNNAQYEWRSTNGFTSNQAKVSLTKAGNYFVKVTSGFGCINEDEISIKTNQATINSEFLLSTLAYKDEEVILVNTSNPFGESTKWIIPNDVQIVDEQDKYITLHFDAVGVYTIGLQQTQGECYATYNKNITIEERTTMPNSGSNANFINDFIVTPNPSDGNFTAKIKLENDSPISLRLYSVSGQFISIQKKESGKKTYEVDFKTTLVAGTYILVLEAQQQTMIKKIIIY